MTCFRSSAAAGCCSLVIMTLGLGCRSVGEYSGVTVPRWDVDRAEVVNWVSEDPSFEQDFALEASGLAASGRYLFVPSEKYARLLVIDAGSDAAVRVIPLAVPRHAELEGVAIGDGSLFFCDEAHAAVYWANIETDDLLGSDLDDLPLPVREVVLEGIAVRGGKIGFEGIEVGSDGRSLYLLLERSGDETSGCVSRIFRLRLETGRLVVEDEPLEIPLEDCAWRLTGLAWWGGGCSPSRPSTPESDTRW